MLLSIPSCMFFQVHIISKEGDKSKQFLLKSRDSVILSFVVLVKLAPLVKENINLKTRQRCQSDPE